MTGTRTRLVTFFLDANVLISAAWKPNAEVARIWQMEGVRLMTSLYVMSEVERNLPRIDQTERLHSLMVSVGVLPLSAIDDEEIELPEALILPAKDRPVLRAAMRARADHLITGDKKHFGQWFGQSIGGVRIESPTTLLMHFRLRKP